jgi:hypothetical protein
VVPKVDADGAGTGRLFCGSADVAGPQRNRAGSADPGSVEHLSSTGGHAPVGNSQSNGVAIGRSCEWERHTGARTALNHCEGWSDKDGEMPGERSAGGTDRERPSCGEVAADAGIAVACSLYCIT